MPDNVQQLVLQVAANVATAQRSLADLARSVQQSTGQMNTSLDSVATHQSRLGQSFNQTRIAQMELSHVITASVDAYAAGYNPIRIMTLEMGRLAQAATFLGGAGGNGILGGFAKFMGGPWGLAVLLGATALTQLFTHMDEGSKTSIPALIQKMREHAVEAQNSQVADKLWSNTIDGLIERNQKLVDTLSKRLSLQEAIQQKDLATAAADAKSAQERLNQDLQRQKNLQQQLALAQRPQVGIGQGGSAGATNTVDVANLSKQLDAVNQQIAKDRQGIALANEGLAQSEIVVAQDEGKALADLGEAAKQWGDKYQSALTGILDKNKDLREQGATIEASFNQVEQAMKKAAEAGAGDAFYKARTEAKNLGNELGSHKITVTEYATAMANLASQLTAAAKAAQDAKKQTGELSSFNLPVNGRITGEFGEQRPGHLHAGVDIAVPVRTPVKAPAAGTVIEAGTLPGYGNVVFIDHGGGTISRLAHLSQISVQRGEQVSQGTVIGLSGGAAGAAGSGDSTGPHVHYEVRVNGKAVNPLTGRFKTDQMGEAAKAQDKAAQIAQQQTEDADEFARESAQLDAQIIAARKAQLTGFDQQAAAEAQEVEDQRDAALAAVQKKLDEHKLNKAQAEQLAYQIEELAAAKLATIAHKQYVQGLQQQAEMQAQELQFKVDDLQFLEGIATNNVDRRKLDMDIIDIQFQIKQAHLENLKAVIQSTKDWQQSIDLVNQVKEIDAQIAHLPVEKAQAQYDAVQKTLDPFQQWAKDLPHTAADVEQQLQGIAVHGFDGLASAITDVITGTKSMKQAFHDLANSVISDILQMVIKMLILKAVSSIFGAVPSLQSINPSASNYIPPFPARASGGPVTSGNTYLVGEDGPELFTAKTSGFIVPNKRTLPSLAGVGNGGPQQVEVHVYTDDNFHAEVRQEAAKMVIAAAPTIITQARKTTVKSLTRPTITGGRG